MNNFKKLIRVKNQDTYVTLLKTNFLKKPPPPKPSRYISIKALPRVRNIRAESVVHKYIHRGASVPKLNYAEPAASELPYDSAVRQEAPRSLSATKSAKCVRFREDLTDVFTFTPRVDLFEAC